MRWRDISERFAEKWTLDTASGCWLWTGAVDDCGYGLTYSAKIRSRRAHRVSYQLHVGPIPSGLHVLHRCDVPACVNPDHLFLGTQSDNMADMVAKGRAGHPEGEANPNARLTAAQVDDIRARRGVQRQLDTAREFGVGRTCVQRIQCSDTWRAV